MLLAFGMGCSSRLWTIAKREVRSRITSARAFASTMHERLFSGTVTLAAFRPTLLLGRLNDLSANAAPASLFWMTIPCRFCSGTEALQASGPGLLFRELGNFAITAHPTGFAFAIPAGLLLGPVGVTISRATFLFGHLRHLSIHAAPNLLWCAMCTRFFFGSVTL